MDGCGWIIVMVVAHLLKLRHLVNVDSTLKTVAVLVMVTVVPFVVKFS